MRAAISILQNAITVARRSVHQTSFSWALVQAVVRSTTQRNPTVMGAGVPRIAISASKPGAASRVRVTPVSYPRSRWTVIPASVVCNRLLDGTPGVAGTILLGASPDGPG